MVKGIWPAKKRSCREIVPPALNIWLFRTILVIVWLRRAGGGDFVAAVDFGYLLNEQPCVLAPIGIYDVVCADRLHECLS